MNPLPDRLLIVTDRHQATRPLEQLIEEAGSAGGRWVWLRDRDLAPESRHELASRLRAVTRRCGMALSIGDDIALAADIAADGVHLRAGEDVAFARRQLGTMATIGVSAHSFAEIHEAASAGADYATLSPIFATSSKPGHGPALGTRVLRAAASTGLPILALGGITSGRVAACIAAGAAGIATMGGIMRASSPGKTVAALLRQAESALAHSPLPDGRPAT